MQKFDNFSKIFLCKDSIDMRKQRNGVLALIEEYGEQVFDGALFVFINNARTIVRCIYWDSNVFAIWSKFLVKDRFIWPNKMIDGESLTVSSEQIKFFLKGIDITRIQGHKQLEYKGI